MAGDDGMRRGVVSAAVAEMVPDGVSRIMGAIRDAGRQAWPVGGCIRDVAMGEEPVGWDVVTDATAEELEGIVSAADGLDAIATEAGDHAGTVMVSAPDGTYAVSPVRGIGGAAPRRGIDGLLDDLSARDFTVNSMAWSKSGGLVDLGDGLGDLARRTLRCQSSPHAVIWADPIRILRALRLSATRGLDIAPALSGAIHAMRTTLPDAGAAADDVRSELVGLLCAEDTDRLRSILLDYRDVVFEVVPELREGDGLMQVSPWHDLTVYEHVVSVVCSTRPDERTRLAALLHDVAKPACMVVDGDGVMHFPGHPEEGAEMAESVLRRLGFGEETTRSVSRIIRHHDDRPTPDRMGVGSVMRELGDVGEFERWLDLYGADVSAQSDYARSHSLPEIARIRAVADAMEGEGCPVATSGLAVAEEDVSGLGVSGDLSQDLLETLLAEVMAGELPNDRDALARRAVEFAGGTDAREDDPAGDLEDTPMGSEEVVPTGSEEEDEPMAKDGTSCAFRGVSLYSGAGGVDVGFERAGVEVVWANELVADFAETYKKNHQDDVMHVGDIEEQMDTLDGIGDVDIVFGGPPCQAFSVAGKMDPDDPRGKLIFTFLDVVEKVGPRCFVMENVKALGEMRRWEDVRARYMQRATSLGYECHRFTLLASDYGVPQKRERTFFVGIRKDVLAGRDFEARLRELLDAAKTDTRTVRDAIADLGPVGTDSHPDTCPARITFAKHPILRGSAYAGMYFNGQGRPIDLDGFANTLPASMGGNRTPIIDDWHLSGKASSNWVEGYLSDLQSGKSPKSGVAPSRLRRLTVREAARIQTFPDDYEFAGSVTSVYRQIGNAVPCDFAEAVARSVVSLMGELDGR